MIGPKIKAILDSKNKSQKWLAEKLEGEISQSYLSELINGKYDNISAKKVAAIAKALKVPVSRLLDNS